VVSQPQQIGTTANQVLLDVRSQADFNRSATAGAVNVPFDDWFETNAAQMLQNPNARIEVCSYDSPTAQEVVDILIHDLRFPNATIWGTNGIC
jgi:rhodanese-related sulfurtransferase